MHAVTTIVFGCPRPGVERNNESPTYLVWGGGGGGGGGALRDDPNNGCEGDYNALGLDGN